MNAARQIAPQIATVSQPFTTVSTRRVERVRSEFADSASDFNLGDAIAASGYAILGLYTVALITNFFLGL